MAYKASGEKKETVLFYCTRSKISQAAKEGRVGEKEWERSRHAWLVLHVTHSINLQRPVDPIHKRPRGNKANSARQHKPQRTDQRRVPQIKHP